MSNQVLALHRVSRRCFDMAGVRTGNVRDQLLRSTVVVNALASEGLIGRGSALLVYGAGPAGLNAAMQAAAYHANVTVVERSGTLFSTISAAWWRRIDATEYDWPHNHWQSGVFPVRGTIPLRQKSASSGASLANGWSGVWNIFAATRNGKAGYGTVEIIHNLDAVALKPIETNTLLAVTGQWTPASSSLPPTAPAGAWHMAPLSGPPVVETRWFGALLSCVGHGDEQVTESPLNGHWNGYAGPGFWTDSDGIVPGNRLPPGVSKVVISGAGDGGMQDFQRVTTSRCGYELLGMLDQAARDYPDILAPILPPEPLQKRLLSADEAGRRAFCWAPHRHGAPLSLAKWHDDFEQPIKALVNGWPDSVALLVAKYLFRPEAFEDQGLTVEWVMREPNPGYAYALNRYLVILLQSLADRILPGKFNVRPLSAISEIVPVGHTCDDAAGCIGKTHTVRIDRKNLGPLTRNADLIIIRHGVEPRPLLLSGRLPVQEQISPFDLPS